MKPTLKTKTKGKGPSDLSALLKSLAKKQVLVGVPEDHTQRNTQEMTNAGLVYIHTHGSALMRIPARPIIEPALKAPDNRARITKELAQAAEAVLASKPREVAPHLNRAGLLGANAAKRWFVDPRNGWAPNAAETVERKGSDRPLIDTAQMRRSITYVVKDGS
jgi:hypothetical protein